MHCMACCCQHCRPTSTQLLLTRPSLCIDIIASSESTQVQSQGLNNVQPPPVARIEEPTTVALDMGIQKAKTCKRIASNAPTDASALSAPVLLLLDKLRTDPDQNDRRSVPRERRVRVLRSPLKQNESEDAIMNSICIAPKCWTNSFLLKQCPPLLEILSFPAFLAA